MKIIFAGTPLFAASALEALLIHQYEIVAVLTQPDRPAGRGMQVVQSPVKQLALQHAIPVLQPRTLKNVEIHEKLATLNADVMIVAAYGLILPAPVLQIPLHGCLNIHASLLPRWRGAAPIQRALLAGDNETGITIMQMDEGLDTGAIVLKYPCSISTEDNSQTLHDKLAKLGGVAIIDALRKLDQDRLTGIAQQEAQATYAAKLTKAEAVLDWTQSASHLGRAVRAYNPFPGAQASLNGTIIKIWQASVLADEHGEAGTVIDVNKSGIKVACGTGVLLLESLQKPGGKVLPSSQFIPGFMIKAGDRFSPI